MSSPALPPHGSPAPALLSPSTARSIRDALIDAERALRSSVVVSVTCLVGSPSSGVSWSWMV